MKFLGFVIVIAIFASAIFAAYYFYSKYNKAINNPEMITRQETDLIKEKVSKLMDIPADEEPTLATVLDKDKLSDQAFFANAENGDKVLIFTKAKKAILYRPSTNKIIEVAPLAIDDAALSGQNIKVAILNGTKNSNLATTTGNLLDEKLTNIEVISSTIASKTNYGATIVVDYAGKYANEVKDIAEAVGGSVSDMPNGETAPEEIGRASCRERV